VLEPSRTVARATVRSRLVERPWHNIAPAGLNLRTYLDQVGGNPIVITGGDHLRTPTHHHAYRSKVLQAACYLFVDYQSR